jgi:hypothetical protein
LNVVSSAILWGVWNNRNNLVSNKVAWINMKQVWRLVLLYTRNWKVPFKGLEGEKLGQFMDTQAENPSDSTVRLTCTDFGWISTWKLQLKVQGMAAVQSWST